MIKQVCLYCDFMYEKMTPLSSSLIIYDIVWTFFQVFMDLIWVAVFLFGSQQKAVRRLTKWQCLIWTDGIMLRCQLLSGSCTDKIYTIKKELKFIAIDDNNFFNNYINLYWTEIQLRCMQFDYTCNSHYYWNSLSGPKEVCC